MTLIQLRCFVALAEELNFTRVAERLFVSQTSISYQIKTLERELGVELFERSTKAVNITDAGKMIYRDIKLAIDLVDRAEELLRLNPTREVFTLGYSLFCSGPLLHEVVRQLGERHPDVDIFLEHIEPEDDIRSRLLSRNIDAALIIDPFNSMYEGMEHFDLGSTKRALYVSRRGPLARRSDPINEAGLVGEKIITFAQVETRHKTVNTLQNDSRLVIARDVAAAMEMVAAGLGVAVFPAVCFTEINGVAVKRSFVPLPEDEDMTTRLALIWHRGNRTRLIKELCADLRSVVEEQTPELLD